MRSRFHAWLTVAAALLLGVTVAGACGATHWLLDLASHFRAYCLLAAAVGLPLALRRPRSPAVACLGLALAGNAWAMLPFWMPPTAVPTRQALAAAAPDDGVPPLSVVSANLYCLNRDTSLAVAYLRDRRPDVAMLQEVTPDWAACLSSLAEIYPHRIVETRNDGFGIALLSRWPLSGARVVTFAGVPLPTIEATVRFHGRDVHVVTVHPRWPLGRTRAAAMLAQLSALADAVATEPRPCIVAGDFNATPWSVAYRTFVAHSGLRDTALGRGVQPTWNARTVAPRIPIDHVFASPDLAVLRRAVGPDIGSDHFPVEATLVLPPAE